MISNGHFRYYLKHDYQVIINEGITRYSKEIDEIVQKYLMLTTPKPLVQRGYQLVVMNIFQFLFGLNRSKAYSILISKDAQILNEFILKYHSSFPCRSSSNIHMKLIPNLCTEEFNSLMTKFQDYFYVTIGENTRKEYTRLFQTNRKKVTPIPESFFGIIPPSQIFPNMNVHTRGVLIPFLNARIYQKTKHYSSISEFIGEIKEPDFDNNEFIFRLAGKLGFITGPPGKHKFYEYFSLIDASIQDFENLIDEQLSHNNIHDFTVTSVDCCNIPVDKRDQTGSKGTGSRGSFFGHKTSISAGSYCLPFKSVTGSGRVSDSTLFDATFSPVERLAQKTNQDIWVGTADAAYLSQLVIDRIEKAEAIAFIDLNPRNSPLLSDLKNKTNKLSEYSKKALKKGLTLAERKIWVEEAKNLSLQNGGSLSLQKKRSSSKNYYENMPPKPDVLE